MPQLIIDLDLRPRHLIAEARVFSSWPVGYKELLGSIDDPTFKAPDELSE